jgi:integrase
MLINYLLQLAERGSIDRLRTCHECHKWFYAITDHQKNCSEACRQRFASHDQVFKKRRREYMKEYRPFEVYSIWHTFLTRLGGSGCDAWTLARIAGHSNISISQRYVHPSEDAVLNALSRLSGHNIGHSAQNVIPAGSGELSLNTANREG